MLAYVLEHNRYLNIVGIFVILAIAFVCSKNRKAVDFKLVAHALGLQCLIALAVLKTSLGHRILSHVSDYVSKIYQFADEGSQFIFGNLVNASASWGFIFAIKVLPVIIFFGALTALLFYWGIVQKGVQAINYVVQPLLGTTGPETLCAITNSFLGQTEAPLLVRDYLKKMSKSELLVVMVSGMGTISGAILVVFVAMGVPAPHLLTASVMSIPTTIMMAKILLPETKKTDDEQVHVTLTSSANNIFDAIAAGTLDGLSLALNVAAMLISFVALLALVNALFGFASDQLNIFLGCIGSSLCLPNISLQMLLGYLFAPFAWLLGFEGSVALKVGELLGIKEGIALMVLGQNMAQEAIDGLKKLEQKRDEIVAFGQEAEAQYNKLIDSLQQVQDGATKLYQQGMHLVEEEAANK
jgi:CNT family concentrative nucleoside transporter